MMGRMVLSQLRQISEDSGGIIWPMNELQLRLESLHRIFGVK